MAHQQPASKDSRTYSGNAQNPQQPLEDFLDVDQDSIATALEAQAYVSNRVKLSVKTSSLPLCMRCSFLNCLVTTCSKLHRQQAAAVNSQGAAGIMGADLHGGDVLGGGNALIIEAQPFFHLLLHLLPKRAACQLTEAVNPAPPATAHAKVKTPA